MKFFLLIILIHLLYSCKFFRRDDVEKKDAIAKAFDYYLYLDDLVGVVPSGASREDSITIVKNYIDNWVRHKAVLHKAESNLDDDKKNVSRQLEEYRNSLITYAYET